MLRNLKGVMTLSNILILRGNNLEKCMHKIVKYHFLRPHHALDPKVEENRPPFKKNGGLFSPTFLSEHS